jgi:hypothetical protein
LRKIFQRDCLSQIQESEFFPRIAVDLLGRLVDRVTEAD